MEEKINVSVHQVEEQERSDSQSEENFFTEIAWIKRHTTTTIPLYSLNVFQFPSSNTRLLLSFVDDVALSFFLFFFWPSHPDTSNQGLHVQFVLVIYIEIKPWWENQILFSLHFIV